MPKLPKPKHPDDMNGTDFNSPGGREIHSVVWGMNARLGKVEGILTMMLVLIPVIFGMLGVLLAKAFGAF